MGINIVWCIKQTCNRVSAFQMVLQLRFEPERLQTHPASQTIIFLIKKLKSRHHLLLLQTLWGSARTLPTSWSRSMRISDCRRWSSCRGSSRSSRLWLWFRGTFFGLLGSRWFLFDDHCRNWCRWGWCWCWRCRWSGHWRSMTCRFLCGLDSCGSCSSCSVDFFVNFLFSHSFCNDVLLAVLQTGHARHGRN